jgi:flagellar motor protein MotB
MLDIESSDDLPVWPVFADVLACLGGLIALLFVWAVVAQADLTDRLAASESAKAQAEAARAEVEAARHLESVRLGALEAALAGPVAEGRISLEGATVGIQGNVLFPLASSELSPEGAALVAQLAQPLTAYTEGADAMLMISGFTDTLMMNQGATFADNWELSAERALTVTRALVHAGFPPQRLVAAGFGEHHPVADNASEDGRAKNRRVEITPVPRNKAPTQRAHAVPSSDTRRAEATL